MDRLESRITDHPLTERLAALQAALDAVPDEIEQAIADAGREGAVERAVAMADYVGGLLEAADPRLVAQAALDTVQGHVDQAIQATANLEPDPAGQSSQLEQAVDSALQAAAPLAAAAAGFAKSTQRMGRRSGALTKRLKRLDGEAEMIAEELAALDTRRQSGLEELATAEAEKRDELQQQLAQVRTELDTERQKLESLGAQQQERFEGSEEERAGRFEELIGQLERRTDEAVQRGEKAAANVEDLYAVASDSATAGAFADEAASEKRAADSWRWLTVGFGVLAGAIAVGGAVFSTVEPVSVATLSTKFTATIVFLGLAAFAGRQSEKHRDRANGTKDLALELVTFEGAIHGLDEGEQRAIRKQFLERAYRGRSIVKGSPAPEQSIEALGLTPEILGVLMAVLKAMQGQTR